MGIEDTRRAYQTILITLKAERVMRAKVLPEPRRTKALQEIDDAIVALAVLGAAVKLATDAGLLEETPPETQQAQLLDLPKNSPRYL